MFILFYLYNDPDVRLQQNGREPTKKKVKMTPKHTTLHTMMERFKAWADRMSVNETGGLTLIDARSVAKSHGKVILPKEMFADTIMGIHTKGFLEGKYHRSFMETVAMVMLYINIDNLIIFIDDTVYCKNHSTVHY